MVPLLEFGRFVGLEASYVDQDASITTRSSKGRKLFPVEHFFVRNRIAYVSLTELAELTGARIHTIGEEIYVETEPVSLTSFDPTSNEVTVRFDGFVPCRTIEAGGGRIRLRFYHCSLATASQWLAFNEGPISSVELREGKNQTVELTVDSSSAHLPQLKRFSSAGLYSLSLVFDHELQAREKEEILPSITYNQIQSDLGHGTVRTNYLYIDSWRDHYQLSPAIPLKGVGNLAYLRDMAQFHGAPVAINANFFDTATNIPVGLLIVNGEVQSSNYERRGALGIDIFGHLVFFNPTITMFLRVGGEKIILDDVNRPIKSNEIVVYTPGYTGDISRGSLESYRVLRVRSNRVVAAEDSPYIARDSSATLIVASGTACSRLAMIGVSDEVNIEHVLDQGDPLITDAVSAGPLLMFAGKDVLDPRKEAFSLNSPLVNGLASRSVLATDWYGGLILLAVVKDTGSVGADFADLLAILHSLPVRIKNAIAFDGGHSSSLVFKEGATYWEIGAGGKVAAGLIL
ncbi:MAG: hypothetical protein E3J82_00855, partial [Candidatus Thorarchaeota archaeon]